MIVCAMVMEVVLLVVAAESFRGWSVEGIFEGIVVMDGTRGLLVSVGVEETKIAGMLEMGAEDMLLLVVCLDEDAVVLCASLL